MFNALDAESMDVAWQVIVDGNLDNTDADYTGRFVASTCYNSEKGMTLTETMRNERDWVVVFDVEAIEAAVAAGNYNTLGESSVPVLDGRKGSQLTRYIPIPKNPHGVNTGWQIFHRQRQAIPHLLNHRHRQVA